MHDLLMGGYGAGSPVVTSVIGTDWHPPLCKCQPRCDDQYSKIQLTASVNGGLPPGSCEQQTGDRGALEQVSVGAGVKFAKVRPRGAVASIAIVKQTMAWLIGAL